MLSQVLDSIRNTTCEFIGRLQKHFTKSVFLWSPNKGLNWERRTLAYKTNNAANAGETDCLFKRHGHWASESDKEGYVQDSFSSLLSVSKALGIWFSYSYRFLIYSRMYLVGLAQGTVSMGVQLAWGFPPRCK